MDPIFLLKELDILSGCKTALDVGTKDGSIATRLAKEGLVVDAIDIRESEIAIKGVHFQKMSVEDFLDNNIKNYDLIVARHVLHHTIDPKKIIKDLNNIANIFFFTFFGPKDDWTGKVSTLSHNEVLQMFDSKSVRHHSEAFQYETTYTNDLKYWHINTFVIDNRQLNN